MSTPRERLRIGDLDDGSPKTAQALLPQLPKHSVGMDLRDPDGVGEVGLCQIQAESRSVAQRDSFQALVHFAQQLALPKIKGDTVDQPVEIALLARYLPGFVKRKPRPV